VSGELSKPTLRVKRLQNKHGRIQPENIKKKTGLSAAKCLKEK